jgi:hypothetical protein
LYKNVKEAVISSLKIISQNWRAGADRNEEEPQDTQSHRFESEGLIFRKRRAVDRKTRKLITV